MSEKIKKEFNQLKGLNNSEMQRLLRHVDPEMLAMSLTDADEGLKQKVFANMSGRAVNVLKINIDENKNTPEAAIIKSKENILSIYKKLLKDGEIS